MDKIVPNLYLSGFQPATNKNELTNKNIKCIINITMQPDTPDKLELYKKLDIIYVHINEYDSPIANLYKYFDKTHELIQYNINKNNNVLVHCMAGISRSATIVIAHLMKAHALKLKIENSVDSIPYSILPGIIHYVKCKRPCIEPNQGFVNQLRVYEEKFCNFNI